MNNEVMRRCIVCRELKNREEMLKITKKHDTKEVVLNPDSKTFGRSAYFCYNKSCIKDAFKKNRIEKSLKTPISEELKAQIEFKTNNFRI